MKPHTANEINSTACLFYTRFAVLSLTQQNSPEKYTNNTENNLAARI
jgi:hypothetical protein